MGSNATAATASTAAGIAGALMIIVGWLLSFAHVTMPSDVTAAASVLLIPLIHGPWLRWVEDPVPPVPTAMVPVTVEAAPGVAEAPPAAPAKAAAPAPAQKPLVLPMAATPASAPLVPIS